MKIIKFDNKKDNEASEIAKELYDKCKSSEISAFITVTLDKNNDTSLYVGNNENDRKSILECLGAVFMLQNFAYEMLDEMSEE